MKSIFFIAFTLLLFSACQSEEQTSTEKPSFQSDSNETTTAKLENKGMVIYDLPKFSCRLEGEEWIPDLASARVFYSDNATVDSVQILANRAEGAATLNMMIYLFKGVGTYNFANDPVTGKGIGTAIFLIRNERKAKDFYSVGGQVVISYFNEENGVISGTFEVPIFRKGDGMMPDARDITEGTFSGNRVQ